MYPADMRANCLILSQKEEGSLYSTSGDFSRPEIIAEKGSVDRTEVYTSILELARLRLNKEGECSKVYSVDYGHCLAPLSSFRLRWLTDFTSDNEYIAEEVAEIKLVRTDSIHLRKSEISLHYFDLSIRENYCLVISDGMRLGQGEYYLEVIGLTSTNGERVVVNKLAPGVS